MAKIREVIELLEVIERKHGNVDVKIYKSFDKVTTRISGSDIYFDKELKEAHIGIYN